MPFPSTHPSCDSHGQGPCGWLWIGCGSWKMDLPWIRQMTRQGLGPYYVAMDPSAHSLASFEAAALPSLADAALTLKFFTGKYENFAPLSPFERIILMHSLYHFFFQNVPPSSAWPPQSLPRTAG